MTTVAPSGATLNLKRLRILLGAVVIAENDLEKGLF
jgi:hypothetical protein